MYREASDIGLRRAVTISIFYGIKVLLLSNALSSPRRTQGTIQSGSSVLSSLLNVSSSMDSALLVEDSSGITNDIMANSIAVAAIDWVMTTIQTETDEHSFGIKQKILVLLRDNINW